MIRGRVQAAERERLIVRENLAQLAQALRSGLREPGLRGAVLTDAQRHIQRNVDLNEASQLGGDYRMKIYSEATVRKYLTLMRERPLVRSNRTKPHLVAMRSIEALCTERCAEPSYAGDRAYAEGEPGPTRVLASSHDRGRWGASRSLVHGLGSAQ